MSESCRGKASRTLSENDRVGQDNLLPIDDHLERVGKKETLHRTSQKREAGTGLINLQKTPLFVARLSPIQAKIR